MSEADYRTVKQLGELWNADPSNVRYHMKKANVPKDQFGRFEWRAARQAWIWRKSNRKIPRVV